MCFCCYICRASGHKKTSVFAEVFSVFGLSAVARIYLTGLA